MVLLLLLLPSSNQIVTLGSFRPIVVTEEIQTQLTTEADNLNAQVAKLYEEGKYNQAIPLAKRALEIRESLLGHNSLPTAVSLSRLAALYFALKEYESAELNYRESLAVYERMNEGNNLNVAKITDRLAFLSYQKQDSVQAEAFYLRSLAIREAALEPGNTNVIQSMSNLAQFYRTIGKHDKATSLYERIVALEEKALNAGRSETGETLEGYACALRHADKDSEAKRIEELVNRIFNAPGKSKKATNPDPDVLNGKAVELPPPDIPPVARLSKSFGRINVRILIDESGRVIRACAVSGPGLFYSVSETAALKATFTPTLKGGRPIKVVGLIRYEFRAR